MWGWGSGSPSKVVAVAHFLKRIIEASLQPSIKALQDILQSGCSKIMQAAWDRMMKVGVGVGTGLLASRFRAICANMWVVDFSQCATNQTFD